MLNDKVVEKVETLEKIDELSKGIAENLFGGKEIVWITGAGISLSAGIPLWNHIREVLYTSLFNTNDADAVERRIKELIIKDEEWIRKSIFISNEEDIEKLKNKVKSIKGRLPAEFIMSFYLRQYGILEVARFYRQFFEKFDISPTYKTLVNLYKWKMWRYYITFNLDYVMERVLSFFDIPYFSIIGKYSSEISDESLLYMADESAVVLDIHGSYVIPESLEINYTNLLYENIPDVKRKIIERILSDIRNAYIIIIGYSGQDRYFMEGIKKILQNIKTPLHVLYVSPRASKKINDIKNYLYTNRVSLSFINATSDLFLSILEKNIINTFKDKTKKIWYLSQDKIYAPKERKDSYSIYGKGSLVLAGDYGVYKNGKMLQIAIPNKIEVEIVKGGKLNYISDIKINVRYFLPQYKHDFNRSNEQLYGQLTIDDKNRVEEITRKIIHIIQSFQEQNYCSILKNCHNMNEKMKEYLKEEIKKLSKGIETLCINLKNINEINLKIGYPPFQGLGDSLIPTIFTAIVAYDKDDCQYRDLIYFNPIHSEKVNNLVNTKAYFEVLKFLLWCLTYQNTSFLRPLGSYFDINVISYLKREINYNNNDLDLKDYIKSTSFKLQNLKNVDLYKILSNAKEYSYKNLNLGFAIIYWRRRILLEDIEQRSYYTGTAVDKMEIEAYRELSDITDDILNMINGNMPIDMGKLGSDLNLYHFMLSRMKRSSSMVDDMITSIRRKFPTVLGGKISGSGPAGGILIVFKDDIDILGLIEEIDKMGFTLISVLKP